MINSFEKRNKVNTILCRPIYKITEETYFKESEMFPDDFVKQSKDNANEAQFILLEVKDNIKRMATKQEFQAKLVKLNQKYLKCIAANKNKNEAKFNFQGPSARSQHWFDLDLNELN